MPDDDLAAVSYDYSAVAPGGVIFTAGACPLDAGGRVVAPGDHAAQTVTAVRNLSLVLARHGASFEHLLRTTIYVVGDRSALTEVWSTVLARLAPFRPPSTLLGVAVLGYEHQLVEIDAIAALPWSGDAPEPGRPGSRSDRLSARG